MSKEPQEGVTELLERWSRGEREALDKLMPLVYQELRRLANNYLRRERVNHTLQPTALVNEAYMRLIEQRNARWQNRAQFFAVSAQLMRRILVDHARANVAAKRGGPKYTVSLSHAEHAAADAEPNIELLALHEALKELMAIDPQQARIVELRYFGGLSIEETAEVMNVSHATVEREWKMARAWLYQKMSV